MDIGETLVQVVRAGNLVRVLERGGRLDVAEPSRPGLELLIDVEALDLSLDVEDVRAGRGGHHVAVVCARGAEARGDGERKWSETAGLHFD